MRIHPRETRGEKNKKDAAVRAKLSQTKWATMLKQALELGIDEASLEKAFEADDAKAAVFELISHQKVDL